VFFILNLVLWSKGSSGAISFGILVALLALWFGISVPLTFVGAFFGFRRRVSSIKPFRDYGLVMNKFLLIGYRASSEDESDPSSGPRSERLYPPGSGNRNGWCPALRLHFYPAIFHPQLSVVQSNLLHVWFPVRRLCDSLHHLLRNDYSTLLFPPLRRGKLTAIKIFYIKYLINIF